MCWSAISIYFKVGCFAEIRAEHAAHELLRSFCYMFLYYDTEDAAELEFTYCFFVKCCRDDDGDHGNVKGSGMLSVFG